MYQRVLADWERSYQQTGEPTAVDFRRLVAQSVSTERFTHLLHPYPAKLLPQIPYLFLRAGLTDDDRTGVTVADPFCGSGTVLLEAVLLGFRAIGADTNPLARLISRVKIRPISTSSVAKALSDLNRRVSRIRHADPPPVVNIGLWYREETASELAKLRKAIAEIPSRPLREFMQVCFSVCARKVSLADPRLSVPVRINLRRKDKYGPHFTELNKHIQTLGTITTKERFNEIVDKNAMRLGTLQAAIQTRPSVRLFGDARGLEKRLLPGEVQLVITSPPYAGAQKYIRSSSLSLGWLDMAYEGQLRSLEQKTIGREHFATNEFNSIPPLHMPIADALLRRIQEVNVLRAHIARAYLHEMEHSLRSIYSLLKPGGHLVLVTGTNTICGCSFDTPSFVEQLAIRIGFQTRFKLVDHIRSRGLMTKRNKTADIIPSELVLCMRRAG